MSAAIYSRGRPVYGGGSFAPHRGQVSAAGAQGYIQREARKQTAGPFGGVSKVGADGFSNTRSGVAARAVGRATNGGRPTNGGGGNSHPGTGTVPHPNGTGTGGGGSNGGNGGGNSGGNSGGGNGGGSSNPTVPTVVVDATGQLQLPYDQQFSQDVLDALDQYNAELLQLQQDQQQHTLDYQIGRRDAGINYGNQQRSNLSTSAARGTAFSSQYGTSVSNTSRDYQNKLNDMDANFNLFNQNSELRRASIITAFQRMLANAALNLGNNLDPNDVGPGGGGSGGDGGSINQQYSDDPLSHFPGANPGGHSHYPNYPHNPPNIPGSGGNHGGGNHNGGGPTRRKRKKRK